MFGFVKSTQNATGSGTSLVLTVPAVRIGDLVVVSMKFASVSVSNVSVTDSAGNTYLKSAGPIGAGGYIAYQFYGVAVVGGATTVTINWTTTTSCRATADEFSGGMRTNATVFDKVATGTGTATSGSVVLAPTVAGELVVAGLSLNTASGTVVIGANYLAGTNSASQATVYRQVSTTSETAPISWTGSLGWAEIASAFIPAPTPGNFMPFA